WRPAGASSPRRWRAPPPRATTEPRWPPPPSRPARPAPGSSPGPGPPVRARALRGSRVDPPGLDAPVRQASTARLEVRRLGRRQNDLPSLLRLQQLEQPVPAPRVQLREHIVQEHDRLPSPAGPYRVRLDHAQRDGRRPPLPARAELPQVDRTLGVNELEVVPVRPGQRHAALALALRAVG